MVTVKAPLVSVVIPTYNRSEDLKRAIQSVLNQSFQDFEIIVIDNHSQDCTDEMIKSLDDPQIQVFKVDNRGVIAVSRNKGIKQAKGKYIAFLDSDDWWATEKLDQSIAVLDSGNDLVYHPLWIVNNARYNRLRKIVGAEYLGTDVHKELLRKGSLIPNSSVVVRADVFKKVEGFSEDKEMITVEDFDCWVRFSKITNRFYFIANVLGYYWQGTENASGSAKTKIRANLKLKQVHLDQFVKNGNETMPFWFFYNMGRSYFKINDKKNTRKYLSLILFSPVSFRTNIKMMWMLFRTYL